MFHDTVTVVRPALTQDRYGNEVSDWATATRTAVADVAVLPTSQVEDATGARVSLTTGWRLYSKPGTEPDVRASDRVEWRGFTLEVVGEVARWPHPLRRGAVHHVEAELQKVAG
jgi:head-tail adaptor